MIRSCIEEIGAVAATSDALIWVTEFPIARFSTAPGCPVTTSSSSVTAAWSIRTRTSMAPTVAVTVVVL